MKKTYSPSNHVSRRSFLKQSAAFGAITFLPSYIALGNKSSAGNAPSEMVNLAVVGIGHQGNGDRRAMIASGFCNVVALCDIDLNGAHTAQARYEHGVTPIPQPDPEPVAEGDKPQKTYHLISSARTFTDFRKMFDVMGDEIDAVLIATPDHSHFVIAMLAMSLGKHVYVEKPLAHTYGQCSRLIEMAERSGVATQMGNQGHSGANYFQFKAWREAGLIKNITKITAAMNNPRRWHGWGQDVTAYPEQPLPAGIDWDTWVASAPVHPFSDKLHPQEWRSWFDYGSGAFGDWGPHILDTCHRFLELGLPEKVIAVKRDEPNDFVFPQASTIQFNFPERGPDLPACEVTWVDGQKNWPAIEPEFEAMLIDRETGQPSKLISPGKTLYSKDLVFSGGSHGSALQIIPRDKMLEMRKDLPKFSQKNSSHYANFILACKGEEETRAPFHISGPLTQVFSIGILAQRFGGELEFDRQTQQITNHQEANALLDPAPRKGWEEFYKL